MEKYGNAPSKMMWILFSVLGVSLLIVLVGILFLSVQGGKASIDEITENQSRTGIPVGERTQSGENNRISEKPGDKTDVSGDKKEDKTEDLAPTDRDFDEWVRGTQDYPGLEKPSESAESDSKKELTVDKDRSEVRWSPKTKKTKLIDEKEFDDFSKTLSETKKAREEEKKEAVAVNNGSVEDEMLNSSAKKIKTTVYWIQVASFSDSYKAESLREKFLENGISTVISTSEVNGSTWYRVRIGAFNSKEEAGYYQEQIAGFADISKTYIVEGSVMKAVLN